MVKDILHKFWSFSIIYITVHNFLKLRVSINEGKVVEETQVYVSCTWVLVSNALFYTNVI